MSASRIPEKILQGRRAPIPVVVAALYSPEAQRDDLVLQHQVPAKVLPAIGDARTRSQSIGYVAIAIVLAVLILAVVWAMAR